VCLTNPDAHAIVDEVVSERKPVAEATVFVRFD
jgi:hypothetical protein